jgi:quercetin dioxygenase-like cupin family protein
MKRLIALNVVALVVFLPAVVCRDRALAASNPITMALGLGIITPYHIHGPTFAVDSKKASEVATSQVTWPPDSRTGWHYHPGLVFVTLTSGSLTLYARAKSGCPSTTYQSGQTFLERPRQVVNLVNMGGSTAATVVTIIGIPVGQPARVNAPTPAGCPAL